jgi:hypothetical protein
MARINASRIQLSENFFLDEFTRSETAALLGLDNSASDVVFVALQRLCVEALQPLRRALGPVHITSGYRSPTLNRLIGGAPASQHCFGLAADVVVTGYTPLEVARWIYVNVPGFDQLIHEFGEWVHVSIASGSTQPRRQVLTAFKKPNTPFGAKTVYKPGLMSIEEAKGEEA